MITLVFLAATVSASLIGAVSFAAPEEPHGAISIAFDDSERTVYDYAFPLMQARGMKATFYVITDLIRDFSNNSNSISISELQTLQDYGCEIASHSRTHTAFTGMTDLDIHYQCNSSKELLQSYGFTVNNFAYPYGVRNNHTDSIVSQYYRSARSAYFGPYVMQFPVSQFVLPGFAGEVVNASVLSRLMSIVDQVYKTDGWAIVFFHNVVPDEPDNPYEVNAEDFEIFLDYVDRRGVLTITVDQGLDLTSSPSPPPSVTISPTPGTMFQGEPHKFDATVSGGNPPFSYQWVFNDKAVLGPAGPIWTFRPTESGTFYIYLNVTDALKNEVQSNIEKVSVLDPDEKAGLESYVYLAPLAGLLIFIPGIAVFILKRRR